MAILIQTDGSEQEILPRNGKTFHWEELKELVGGWIERIRLPDGRSIFLNEDGKYAGLPRNNRATLLGRVCGIAADDFVVGDVVVCNELEAGDNQEEDDG